jgi:hypothetical protein
MEEDESGSLQKGDIAVVVVVVVVVAPGLFKSFCSNNTTCKLVNCPRLVGRLPVNKFFFKINLRKLESIPMVLGMDPVSWFASNQLVSQLVGWLVRSFVIHLYIYIIQRYIEIYRDK